jgi:Family of unknown function (DUF6675)
VTPGLKPARKPILGFSIMRERLGLTLAFLAAGIVCSLAWAAGSVPQLPCELSAYPAFPATDGPPNVEVWKGGELGADWNPPACTGWDTVPTAYAVGLAGHFASDLDTEGLLTRVGSMSNLRTVRYWSDTDGRWNPLFVEASALTGPDLASTRGDFTADEIRAGAPLYFLLTDNRSGNAIVTRIVLRDSGPGHIVLEMTNVSALRWWVFELEPTGGMQTLYFLDRQSDGSWHFYSLVRARASLFLLVRFIPRASFVNRAVAMYRYIAGVPTDRDPPAAP